ncbi:alpha-L-fucosidase [Ideonella sp. YS5]|uniref:alpha-L-fucosidase n=1 Tax=Ideonella sp. YS5 TaxID=3453714 RepID=UPI003EED1018
MQASKTTAGAALTRRTLLQATATAGALALPHARAASPAFTPDWDSLIGGYRAPDWFRDAKFGIWAHWTAQCVPEMGDWYARNMYIQGHAQYEHHLKAYGHPSQAGFMEMNHRWKAEHWDPDALLDLYLNCGAKYFVALANHHDNFDNYDSRYHGWNSTRIGPKRDIVGIWAKAARQRGLRFGVSNHAGNAWHWFQTAYGYDAQGPLAGKRYDAFNLTQADGKGQWWESLDPQDLYTGRNMVIPDGFTDPKAAADWHAANDGVWHVPPPANNPGFTRRWFLRCRDLIDTYRPDLLYFDNDGIPLGQAGMDIAAHFYNASMAWHGGKLEAVLNAKGLHGDRRLAVVEDVERGSRDDIQPQPWQTDTCIGDWHYSRSVFDKHQYKSAATVLHILCDVVSKNGNLLLSVPMKGDGTIDGDERKTLDGIATWMARNGEAIHGTRPWRRFGEGPTQVKGGSMGEQSAQPFTAQDIRFTTKGGALHAIALGWPQDGVMRVSSLAQDSAFAPGSIDRVEVVGAAGSLPFQRTRKGLEVRVPEGLAGSPAIALKLFGRGLV